MSKYDIKYLDKMRKTIYLEVEASIAEDIYRGIQWAITKIKELETIRDITRKQLDELIEEYEKSFNCSDMVDGLFYQSILKDLKALRKRI